MIIRKLIQQILDNSKQHIYIFHQYSSISRLKPFALLGCGNPLLDISAHVDPQLLEKYELKANNAYLAEPKHKPLYDELVKDYKVEYTAGGAVQNSLRVCQWILQKPNSTIFFGCVGDDNFARILADSASKDGVCTLYQYQSKLPTGTCAVLITGTKRTLVANLAAAERFTIEHLEKPLNEAFIENAEYFYVSGFFLTVCLPCILKVAKLACSRNNPFIFNLSADFISHFHMDALNSVMPYVDILVGNKHEMTAFAKNSGWETIDRKEIGKQIQNLPKSNPNRSRIVVITQGPSQVLVIQENCVTEFEVPSIKEENIVDTNGAGDAFVGGFLSQYLQEKSLNVCVRCGIYAAQHTIGQNGCTFRGKATFKE